MAKKIYPLNSVRIFISLLVLYHHSVLIFIPALASSAVQAALPTIFTKFTLHLSLSASTFFLLSGFSLSSAYLRKGQGVDKPKFFATRFARLYPLYFVVFFLEGAILVRAFVHRMGVLGGAEVIGANALLLQAWSPQRLGQMNFPSWALSVEIFFCVCFSILGPWLWKLSGARLWLAALALYLGGQALVWGLEGHIGEAFLAFGPPLHLSTFLLGVLVARWLSLEKERRKPGSVKAWQANAVLGVAIAALAVCVRLESLSEGQPPYSHGLLAPIFIAIIWSLSVTSTAVTRWLSGKWMVMLGNASYSVYLLHHPILKLLVHFRLVATYFYPIYVALCVVLGLLSFRFFETPVRSWLMERFEARRLSRATEEPATAEPAVAYSGGVGNQATAD
jgi:peptidoglycan/LPS O-acetylase OafA/YrhL